MEELLREFFIIALLSTAVTYGCSRVKIPPIVGFLITGALFGPSAFGLVQNAESVTILSEIGVVFLLFSIGMELSISELIRLRKPVFIGGGLQVAATIGGVVALCLWFWPGESTSTAVFFGFLVALSSTAIVLKVLQQKGQMESPLGRISLSILVFQDLIIIPMMLATPLLAGHGQADMASLAIKAGQTLALIVGIFLLARKGVPWLLTLVVRTKSREMFLISTLGICLGTAWLTAQLGLSLSLGAFMAGLVVAESEYSHSALEGILPFRDVFTSVFFISVGMLLDMHFFLANISTILVVTLLVLGLKAVLAGGATLALGYPLRPALLVGFALCQVGEFSFVLAKSGVQEGLLTQDNYQLFLAASILTMVGTPFLLNASPTLANRVMRFLGKKERETEALQTKAGLEDHLIIIGFGIGGKLLARAANMAGIGYTILEMNPDTVRHYAAQGEPITHGDATHPAMLESLGILQARVLCIVISDPAAVRGITEVARHMNPNVHILVRTRFLAEVAALKELGASNVIPEEFETAIEIFTRVLSKYLVPRDAIEQFTNEVRAENYDMLRKSHVEGTNIGFLQKYMPEMTVSAFTVATGSALDGVSLMESNLRQRAGITVVAIRREGEMFPHPGGDFTLHAGDIAYVFASPKEATAAMKFFEIGSH
ncbi:monovalent cation:proton antiporter family protein [Desulfovibrio cuneatus]|uniref:monovalent cation:proton antiporter family protein n=1 Tax=Desulfovibrio cuneatus TaxID=159728 RepID=UPI000417B5D5|nr:monovalent cation:proton antiporter family protein [Desulfovibrio cuneatus]